MDRSKRNFQREVIRKILKRTDYKRGTYVFTSVYQKLNVYLDRDNLLSYKQRFETETQKRYIAINLIDHLFDSEIDITDVIEIVLKLFDSKSSIYYENQLCKFEHEQEKEYINKVNGLVYQEQFNSILKNYISLSKRISKFNNQTITDHRDSTELYQRSQVHPKFLNRSVKRHLSDIRSILLKNIGTYQTKFNTFVYTGHDFPVFVSNQIPKYIPRDESFEFYVYRHLRYNNLFCNKEDIPIVLTRPIHCKENDKHYIIFALSSNLKRGIAALVKLNNYHITITIGEIFQFEPIEYIFCHLWNFEHVLPRYKPYMDSDRLTAYAMRDAVFRVPIIKLKQMKNYYGLFQEISENYLTGITQCQFLVLLFL